MLDGGEPKLMITCSGTSSGSYLAGWRAALLGVAAPLRPFLQVPGLFGNGRCPCGMMPVLSALPPVGADRVILGAWMPQRKKKIRTPDGRTLEGTIMPFQAGGEHWNEYFLDDGSVLRLKVVVTEVVRVDGEYDQQGNPVYIANSTNILAVSAPENLMKDGE